MNLSGLGFLLYNELVTLEYEPGEDGYDPEVLRVVHRIESRIRYEITDRVNHPDDLPSMTADEVVIFGVAKTVWESLSRMAQRGRPG